MKTIKHSSIFTVLIFNSEALGALPLASGGGVRVGAAGLRADGAAGGCRRRGRVPAQLQRAAVGAARPLPRDAADGLALPLGGGHAAPAQPRRGHVHALRLHPPVYCPPRGHV